MFHTKNRYFTGAHDATEESSDVEGSRQHLTKGSLGSSGQFSALRHGEAVEVRRPSGLAAVVDRLLPIDIGIAAVAAEKGVIKLIYFDQA